MQSVGSVLEFSVRDNATKRPHLFAQLLRLPRVELSAPFTMTLKAKERVRCAHAQENL